VYESTVRTAPDYSGAKRYSSFNPKIVLGLREQAGGRVNQSGSRVPVGHGVRAMSLKWKKSKKKKLNNCQDGPDVDLAMR
jgi:hypothetical protein